MVIATQPSPTMVSPSVVPNDRSLDDKIQQRKQMNDALRRRLEKQRQLLSELIFPPHVPHKCHAKVEGLVHLLRDLNVPPKFMDIPDELTKGGGNNGKVADTLSQYGEEKQKGGSFPFTEEEWYRMQHLTPQSRNHQLSLRGQTMTPLMKLNAIDKKCGPYQRRAQEFRRQIESKREKAISMNQPFSEKEHAEMEVAKTTIHELNFRYCIAQTSCPNRMHTLQNCWQSIGPEGIKKISELGPVAQDMICKKERQAVERCCGTIMSDLMENTLG